MTWRKTIISILFVLLVGVLSIYPLFQPGFFPMHDDTQPARVQQMAQSLRDGMFPVRWVADLGYGYGYPLFNFYAPLAYYFGALNMFLGVNALIATKIMMGFGMVVAGVTMYLFAKAFWGNVGGIISAVLYIYAPYHALNMYVRGDVAEIWAYAFIPLVFLSIYKIFTIFSSIHNSSQNNVEKSTQEVWIWMIVGSMSYAAVILSHNLTAMMITPFLLLIIFIYSRASYLRSKKIRAVYYMLLTAFLGILLASFYWLPALAELRYTNVLSQIGGKANFQEHFVCLPQLWESQWGFGGSTPSCIDGMSFRIGKIHIILSIIPLVFLPFIKKRNDLGYAIIISSFLLLISVLLTLKISSGVWNTISIMAFFQYPWRFLLLISFFSSFLAGAFGLLPSILQIKKHFIFYIQIVSLFMIFLGIWVLYGKLFIPQRIESKTAEDYVSQSALKWNISKISDEYLPRNIQKPKAEKEIVTNRILSLTGNTSINNVFSKTNQIVVDMDTKHEDKILIRLAPFPAWKLKLNNRSIDYKNTNKGLEVIIPVGKTHLELQYESTIIQKFANVLSIIGVALLFTGIINIPLRKKEFTT